jgi:DNA-binding NtrC family response regulator
MPENPNTNATLLAVLPCAEDRALLGAILGRSNWRLRFTRTFEEARTALNAFSFRAVISESRLSEDHGWEDLLREIQSMANPPPLIVADRLANERLWAEVLNLGGCDLIAKPFDAKEVLHVVSVACAISEQNKQNRPQKRAAPPS